MIMELHKVEHFKNIMMTFYQKEKINCNIVTELINHFSLSIPEIQSYTGVANSTVYRWLEYSDERISFENYQKLLSLYCRCYLRSKNDVSIN